MPLTSSSALMERAYFYNFKLMIAKLSISSLSAVVTALAVANTVNVYRISKQKGAGGVAFSDEPVVDFPLVRHLHVMLHEYMYDTSFIKTKQQGFQHSGIAIL